MTNKDLIKQYVDTGLMIPEYQLANLPDWAKKTYFRKRIIAQGHEKYLHNHEIYYYREFKYSRLTDDEEIKAEIKKQWYLITNGRYFDVQLYKHLSDEWKLKVIKFLIENHKFSGTKIYLASPKHIKRYYMDRIMDEGLPVDSYFLTDYLSYGDQIRYFESLIRNKKRNEYEWVDYMPDKLKLEFMQMVIDEANGPHGSRFLGRKFKEKYKEVTGNEIVMSGGKYKVINDE